MIYRWRWLCLILILLAGLGALIWRMADLSVMNRSFLMKQGDSRTLRVVDIPAYRGMILDRNGTALAVSTPVDSVWMNPEIFNANNAQLKQLAKLTDLTPAEIREKVKRNSDREFVYLVRGLPPENAEQIKSLKIPGIFFQREYRRYYPQGEVTAHVIGLTNVDDQGQEGLELAYNKWLRGIPGKRQVIKDRFGQTVTNLDVLREPAQGHDLTLSLDSRIQFLAYKTLLETVPKYNAVWGSVVVLDVETGEVLAMVNFPSYNPNDRSLAHDSNFRNRAVTDLFEPGSTIKAFSIANALASGKYHPNSIIDTRPGRIEIGGKTIHDDGNWGLMSVTQILQKSSNVGVAKMSLSLPPDHLWSLLKSVGFGERTDSGFPGEASGVLVRSRIRRPIDYAHLAFGYGISVTTLQLSQAYAIIAAGGIKRPISFAKLDQPPKEQQVVMDPGLAHTMQNLLQAVAQGGTGRLAQIPGYQIGGKTGTAYIAGPHGYQTNHYESSFIGMAPMSHPRLLVALVLHDVHGGAHFGAEVAAPAFAKIMQGSLHFMNIAPDNLLPQPQFSQVQTNVELPKP
jgi:cell division protein FtsI (penicillin-binding protein 3)